MNTFQPSIPRDKQMRRRDFVKRAALVNGQRTQHRHLTGLEKRVIARQTGMEVIAHDYELRNPWNRKGQDRTETNGQVVADSVDYVQGLARQKPVDADENPVLAQVQMSAQKVFGVRGPQCKGQTQTTDTVTPHLLVVAALNDVLVGVGSAS